MYEINTEQFNGPLDKLLTLIEEHKLAIESINLATVTEDFIAYVKKIERHVDHKTIADFIQIAAQLLLIKSKSLLPNLELTKEEHRGIQELEERLKRYAKLKNAQKIFAKIFQKNPIEYSRLLLRNVTGYYSPPTNCTIAVIKECMKRIRAIAKKEIQTTHTIEHDVISVHKKIEELNNILRKNIDASFSTLRSGKTKSEIVALFLAILELAKIGTHHIEQSKTFNDILIKNNP